VTLAFFEIGFGEMLVVGFIALLLFGGDLPRVMRSLGGMYRGFRKSMDDLKLQALRPDLPRPTKPAASTPYRPTSMPLPPPAGVAVTPPPFPGTAAAEQQGQPARHDEPTATRPPPTPMAPMPPPVRPPALPDDSPPV
jgi:sec-independent protein translocase protein TatA